MKRTLTMIAIMAGALGLTAWWAGNESSVLRQAHADDSNVNVQGSVSHLRLAIPAGDEVGNILRRDAQLSSGFEVLSRRGFPRALIDEPNFDRKAWIDVGAQAVIKNAESGSQIRFQLFDLSRKSKKPVLTAVYPSADKRAAAHKFMNRVVEHYTGIPGVFGSRIAFVRTRRSPSLTKNVLTMEMDGGNVTSVTANRSLNILPSMGPGGQVLFTSYAKRNPDLWVSRGGSPARVSKQPGLNLGGVMSPTGGSIALSLSKDGNSEIYVLDAGGNIKRRVTNHRAIDGSPTWSPGGDQLAFVSSRSGGAHVYRVSASGGGARRLTRYGSYNQSPDWNPGEGERSQWVAYTSRSGTSLDVFAVNVSTGKTKRLTQGTGRNTDPSWSPDGRLIAFSSSRGGIVVANEDGDNQIQVTRAGTTPDWGPRVY